MINDFRHEDILCFLEDNIGKLTKLKVSSRAKYKQYEEAMMNYLTAESIEDNERIELYKEELVCCYVWLQDKLTNAIKADASLMEKDIVKEYYALFFPGLDSIDIPSDDEMRYVSIFKGCGDDTSDLVDILLCLSPGTSQEEEDRMECLPEQPLLDMLEDQFYRKVDTWIDDLPHNDLKTLRVLIDNDGRTRAPVTVQDLLIEHLAIVDRSLGNDEEDPEFILYPDIRDTLAPYIDAAIRRKEENDEGFLECLFMGIMNMVGVIGEEDAKHAMKDLVRQAGRKLRAADVDHFFAHSMLVRCHRGVYVCSPGGLLFSKLSYSDWEEEQRDDLKTLVPTDLLDVIAHGQYPFIMPHRREERAFWRMLCDHVEEESAYSQLTYYYVKLQDPDYGLKEMIKEMAEDFDFGSVEESSRMMVTLADFSNGIPKFILKGHSSSELFGKDPVVKSPFSHMMPSIPSMPQGPYVNTNKIGRNDPCPCGSGKKYKHCCGK